METSSSKTKPVKIWELGGELHKQHEEKELKIQELKERIKSTKLCLEGKKKKENADEKMKEFKILSEKYESLRDEYNELLAEKKRV